MVRRAVCWRSHAVIERVALFALFALFADKEPSAPRPRKKPELFGQRALLTCGSLLGSGGAQHGNLREPCPSTPKVTNPKEPHNRGQRRRVSNGPQFYKCHQLLQVCSHTTATTPYPTPYAEPLYPTPFIPNILKPKPRIRKP